MQGGLIHEPFVVHTIVAEEEAIVRRVDDDGIVGEALSFQPFHEATDVVIHALNAGEIVLHVALIFPRIEVCAGECSLHSVDRDFDGIRFYREPLVALGAL